jgi:pyruvate formate lyase activating enzyme
MADSATPEAIAATAARLGCRSVAFTYNDPAVFLEYAVDVARACHARDIRTVAVTAGYMLDAPRRELFAHIDAANVDLKAFSEDFYRRVTKGALAPVLETLLYLRRETNVWVEITTLLIPGANDGDDEIRAMSRWIRNELGSQVPLHFTAFHPDYRMTETPRTPPETLGRARRIALAEGLRHVYVGNVHDVGRQSTWCAGCGELLIERDWHQLGAWHLDERGCCTRCGTRCAGVFEAKPGAWGRKRLPVKIGA